VWLLSTGPSSLSLWLETGTGIFWIQGKPGSGKSTLMSYLKDHSQTKYFARAHCQDLIIIRFFFNFRAHSGISNSFKGLLRAFLFQLTSDIPKLSASIAELGKIKMW
jgi:energy-coupling factor transporter ATP-binding protein EcfA2